ncbi:MAG: hypothetical protein AAB229_03060 [Candidatus Hydrogenedentota bacterium]
MPGHAQDWITLVKASEPNTNYGQWFYTGGKTSGTFEFNGVPDGEYEVRVLYDWPTGGYNVMDRCRLTVGSAAPAVPAPSAGGDMSGGREVHTRAVAGTWSSAANSIGGAIPNDEGYSFFLLPRRVGKTYTISARMKFRNHVDYGGAGLAVIDPSATNASHSHFRFQLSERQDHAGVGGWLDVIEQGYPSPEWKYAGRDIKVDEWYQLALEIDGARMRATLDGVEIAAGGVPALASLPAIVNVGFFIIEADVEFQDLRIVGEIPPVGNAAGPGVIVSTPGFPLPTRAGTTNGTFTWNTNLGPITITITRGEDGSGRPIVQGSSGQGNDDWLRNLIIELVAGLASEVVSPGIPSTGGPTATPPITPMATNGKIVIDDDISPYYWYSGIPESDVIHRTTGAAAFRSTGNNHFNMELGRVGDGAGDFRFIEFDLFLMDSSADLQLQIQNSGSWGNRWGFDADKEYNGFNWSMAGTTPGLSPRRWYRIRRDLVDGMKMNPGDRITGLAFSSYNGNALFDRVVLLPASSIYDLPIPAVEHPDTKPAPIDTASSSSATAGATSPGETIEVQPPVDEGRNPEDEALPSQCLTHSDETGCLFEPGECPCSGKGTCRMKICSP